MSGECQVNVRECQVNVSWSSGGSLKSPNRKGLVRVRGRSDDSQLVR